MSAIADRLFVQDHDSPLGRWRLGVLQPHPALAEDVEFMWLVDGITSFEAARILPRGNAHLMFNLGAPQRLIDVYGEREPVVYAHAWISGQQRRFLDVAGSGHTSTLGVRFRPLGAWRVLGLAQHELADRVIDLDALFGDRIHALRQRLLETSDAAARFALFEGWLLERAQGRVAHYAVRWAVQRLAATHGAIPVERLAAELGYSRKHVAQLFQREMGLTPKALARVLRFTHALTRVRSERIAHWDAFALDCGYYDQAHLIREFKAYSGHAPTVFLRHAPIDDEWIVER